MASAMEELLRALEQNSATAKNPNLPPVLESLEESSLVKGIDCFVLAIATHQNQEPDKHLKLRLVRGLTLLLNAYLRLGYYTDAILPYHTIEAFKLGELMLEIAAKDEEKILIGRLASVIMALKSEVTITQLFGDSTEARDILLKINSVNQAILTLDNRTNR